MIDSEMKFIACQRAEEEEEEEEWRMKQRSAFQLLLIV